jgi:hypothetical protein
MSDKRTIEVSRADLAALLAEAPRTAAWQRLANVLLPAGEESSEDN